MSGPPGAKTGANQRARAAKFAEIAAVTFDVGGTLMMPHPSVGAVYREFALKHGTSYEADALNRAFREVFRSTKKDVMIREVEQRERDFWRRVVRETLHASSTRPPANFDAFFDEVWEAFGHADRWRVFPDAAPTLAALRERGYRIGALSNSDRRLHGILAETGLRAQLDAVTVSSEAGTEKPDAAIFRAAQRALAAGLTPRQLLHVGDSFEHDVAGARAAGWSALLVRNDDEVCGGDEINHLADLLALLPGRKARR